MKPAVRSTIPDARMTTPATAKRRWRTGSERHPRLEATRERNDSARPVAARSCMSGLTGMGISPTIIMWAPADATEIRTQVTRRLPTLVGRSTPMTAP